MPERGFANFIRDSLALALRELGDHQIEDLKKRLKDLYTTAEQAAEREKQNGKPAQ